MKGFELYEPTTVSEAVSLLDKFGPGGKALGGGSDLITGVMKDWVQGKGMPLPSQIVDLKQQLDRVHVRNYSYWVVTGPQTSCEHAFDYWFDPQDGTTINREVGGWLLSQLTGRRRPGQGR